MALYLRVSGVLKPGGRLLLHFDFIARLETAVDELCSLRVSTGERFYTAIGAPKGVGVI